MSNIEFKIIVPEEFANKRLDRVIAALCPEHSRSRIQTWINAGNVRVNQALIKQKDKVTTGDIIEINTVIVESEGHEAEAIPLDIIYEDSALIIINKPAGLIVHPGAGNPNHTLVNALLNFDSSLGKVPRAGIIHRLDKDTTGLMIIARTPQSHTKLVDSLQRREIKREYKTIVCGQLIAGGTIESNIGRHPKQRIKMAVTQNGKPATTYYRLIKKYQHYTYLKVQLETGRTHQIRVHMSHIKHPVVGDPIYGKNNSLMKNLNIDLHDTIKAFKRQALHAHKLELPHPDNKERRTFKTELPLDMKGLLSLLDKYDQD